MTNSSSRKIYSKFISTYIFIIVIVFLLLGSFSFVYIVGKEKEKVISNTQDIFNRQCEYTDAQLDNLFNLILSLSSSKDIQLLDGIPASQLIRNIDKMEDVSELVYLSRISTEHIREITVFYENSELFISGTTIGLNGRTFYNTYLSGRQRNYSDFLSQCRQKKEAYVDLFKKDSGDIIAFIGLGSGRENITYIVTLDPQFLIRSLDNIRSYQNSSYRMTNEAGEVLVQAGENFSDGFIVHNAFSRYFPVEQSYSISNKDIYPGLVKLIVFLMTIYFVILFVSIGAAACLSRKISKPVTKIVDTVGDRNHYENLAAIFDGVSSNISSIVSKNERLDSQMSQYEANANDLFINRLLNGRGFSDEEIKFFAKNLNELFEANQFCTVILSFVREEERQAGILWLMQTKEAQGRLRLKYLIKKTGNNKLVIVFYANTSAADFYSEELQKLLRKLDPEKNGIKCYAGNAYECSTGNTAEICSLISKSYRNAVDVMDQCQQENDWRIIYYADMENRIKSSNYNLEMEQKLINMILDGCDDVNGIIDYILPYSSAITNSTSSTINSLCLTMRRVMTKMTNLGEDDKKQIEQLFLNIENSYDINSIKKDILSVIERLSKCAVENNKKRLENMMGRVSEYIDTHYSDNELSVSTIAEYFNVSDSSLSANYRQYTGLNISDYIEQVRMNRIKELLIHSDKKIKEIAKNCGYYNINTFYKAFKRYTGISAKSYREKNRPEQ
jgi:YesN/AraC family two-component response regulator